MIIVETAYHKIISNSDSLPKFACRGKCKSVWWDGGLELEAKSIVEVLTCPKCGGDIGAATEDDYNIINKADNVTDFPGKVVIQTLHEVKPEFEEMAKREWY